MTKKSLNLGQFMMDQVANTYGYGWWSGIISTPDISPWPSPVWSFSETAQYLWKDVRSALHVRHHAIKVGLTQLDLVQMFFTLLLVREICKMGNVAYFGEFYKIVKSLLLYLENASLLKRFCYKNVFLWGISM